MKKLIVFTTLCLLLFASCTKESTTITSSSNNIFSNCVISKLIINNSSSINSIYNSEGKVSSLTISESNTTIPYITYTYVGNKIIATNLQSGGKPITTYYINKMGYVDSIFTEPTVKGVIQKESAKYEYDLNGYLIKTTFINYDDSTNQVKYNNTSTFNYKDGNLVSTNELNGASSTYSYYPDLAQIPEIDNFPFGSIFGKQSKNLLKTYTDKTNSNTFYQDYTYTKDASGKIITKTAKSSSGFTSTTGFEYICK
jgi:hypothetical protein